MGSSTLMNDTRQVTVGEFREFVNETGYLTDCERCGDGWTTSAAGQWVKKPDASWDNPYRPQDEDDPVVFVSGFDAIFFANWKSAREGLVPAYAVVRVNDEYSVECNSLASGYRLPSERDCEQMFAAQKSPPMVKHRPSGKSSAVRRWSADVLSHWCWESATFLPTEQDRGQAPCGNGAPKLCRPNGTEQEGIVPKFYKDNEPPWTVSMATFQLTRSAAAAAI